MHLPRILTTHITSLASSKKRDSAIRSRLTNFAASTPWKSVKTQILTTGLKPPTTTCTKHRRRLRISRNSLMQKSLTSGVQLRHTKKPTLICYEQETRITLPKMSKLNRVVPSTSKCKRSLILFADLKGSWLATVKLLPSSTIWRQRAEHAMRTLALLAENKTIFALPTSRWLGAMTTARPRSKHWSIIATCWLDKTENWTVNSRDSFKPTSKLDRLSTEETASTTCATRLKMSFVSLTLTWRDLPQGADTEHFKSMLKAFEASARAKFIIDCSLHALLADDCCAWVSPPSCRFDPLTRSNAARLCRSVGDSLREWQSVWMLCLKDCNWVSTIHLHLLTLVI